MCGPCRVAQRGVCIFRANRRFVATNTIFDPHTGGSTIPMPRLDHTPWESAPGRSCLASVQGSLGSNPQSHS